MQEIIDVAGNVGPLAARLASAGVKTVIRYYNHENVTIRGKCLTSDELKELQDAGLSVAVVFEQRSGAPDTTDGLPHIEDFSAIKGSADAARALDLAGQMEQPKGSAIYFAVDFDFVAPSELTQIVAYFQAAQAALAAKQYSIGVYGSGLIGQHLRQRGLVDHIWLAGSKGWTGYQSMLQSNVWSLFQRSLDLHSDIGNFGYDGDIANPSFADFGQFGPVSPAGAVSASQPDAGGSDAPLLAPQALFRVTARSGLNLRLGPSDSFGIVETVPFGTIVTGKSLEGSWMKVDLQGDGQVDGYMFERFLEAVSGGLPMPVTPSSPDTHIAPLDVARAEMTRGVAEIPGGDNPRIVLYHSTTSGGPASDETPWCSSFVNFCVEQAGFKGTNSKVALSWKNWHQRADDDPKPGDIVVFERRDEHSDNVVGGHVGFFISRDDGANTIQVLGGNQGKRVCIMPFPRNDVAHGFHYHLVSIRRP